MHDPINVFWTVLGIFIWPSLTLAVILWKLGHPILAILAFFWASNGTQNYVRTRVVDYRTGRTVRTERREI